MDAILRLAILSELGISAGPTGAIRRRSAFPTAQFDLRIPYSDAVDLAGESTRLKKEIEGLSRAIQSKEKQLANPTFRERAPEKHH